ncbi:GIY-YIG nuclease family protein [Candidatus Amoebophilus asiaticus]|nr:GIY-YIG nuclease family protein [Candidatus Amoebophilus asiaticus]
MRDHNYFVYITTNPKKTVLYIGVTNDLERRLQEHLEDNMYNRRTFAGKYFCYNLIYYERHQYIEHAIEREKEIKKWRREKKESLINSFNPKWKFFNDAIKEH